VALDGGREAGFVLVFGSPDINDLVVSCVPMVALRSTAEASRSRSAADHVQ